MRLSVLVLTLVLLVTSACGREDRQDSTRPTDRTTESEPPSVKAALAQAVEHLTALSAVSFRAELAYGGRPFFTSEGVSQARGGWSATTALDAGRASQRLNMRSANEELWVQDPGWREPADGCWMRVPRGASAGGIVAFTAGAGAPGHVTLVSRLEAVEWSSALRDKITAVLPLAALFALLPLPDEAARKLDGLSAHDTLQVRVELDGEVIRRLTVHGTDIEAAAREARLDPDDTRLFGELNVYYDEASARSAELAPPPDDLVMVDPATGCGRAA